MHPPLSRSDITITFPKAEYAAIAKKALEVDPELMEDKIEKSFETAANRFIVWAEGTCEITPSHFRAVDEKTLRLGVSTFFDMVQVVIKALSEFSEFGVC